MVHLHDVRDSDKHFVIDPVTRAITNNSDKNTLMQGDHKSEIYTFEIPKVVEGHDMIQCNRVEIHYNDIAADKANQSKDFYTVDDMHIDEDEPETLCFSWLVHGNATKYAGALSFRIRFGCVDENGMWTYKWHTDIFKGITISDGFDNTAAVIEDYADAIAAWEAELDAFENRIETLEKSGGLTEEQLAELVKNYLEDNPIKTETDTTLTKSGVPADAEVTGKEINDIKSEVANKQPKGEYVTAAALIAATAEHNTAETSHEDIRLLITGIATRINALLDSDDTTLDQMSEVVAYIKANKTLIDSITTSKVSVTDIVDNLTTKVANKPLSAAQGVALKALLDSLSTNKLDADRLPDAINSALLAAKESGAFDGKDYILTKADKQEIAEMVELPSLPENGGPGISVTGAKVGQTIQIAEVDENGVPTAWIPVDMPDGGGGLKNTYGEEIVILDESLDIPTESPVTVIEFDMPEIAKTLNFFEILVKLDIPTNNHTAGGTMIQMFGKNVVYWNAGNTNATSSTFYWVSIDWVRKIYTISSGANDPKFNRSQRQSSPRFLEDLPESKRVNNKFRFTITNEYAGRVTVQVYGYK